MPITKKNFNQIKAYDKESKPTTAQLLKFIETHFVKESPLENSFPNKRDLDSCIHVIDKTKEPDKRMVQVRTQAESERADASRKK